MLVLAAGFDFLFLLMHIYTLIGCPVVHFQLFVAGSTQPFFSFFSLKTYTAVITQANPCRIWSTKQAQWALSLSFGRTQSIRCAKSDLQSIIVRVCVWVAGFLFHVSSPYWVPLAWALTSIVSPDPLQTSWRWRGLVRPKKGTRTCGQHNRDAAVPGSQCRGCNYPFFTCKSLRSPTSSNGRNRQRIQNPHLNAPAPVVVCACHLCRWIPRPQRAHQRRPQSVCVDNRFCFTPAIRDLGKTDHYNRPVYVEVRPEMHWTWRFSPESSHALRVAETPVSFSLCDRSLVKKLIRPAGNFKFGLKSCSVIRA